MADEYISKQRAKDLMSCCLASAKANYKKETDVFKRAKFQCYVETIEAMIDVVGAVEAVDVQPVKRWVNKSDVTDEVVAAFWAWLQEQYEEAAEKTELECGQSLERTISYPNSKYEIVFRKKKDGDTD